ncbi:alcohol dehydrogenase catalytic domain-containing protein [Nonomuraea sp. NPDC049421]|uniref:alcohol dehydrogenase catalytic domain-containing protein n=1 Tax=Nonomuraea sp. NPDC049421 TaxID=3155275 RepID=UPI00341CB529
MLVKVRATGMCRSDFQLIDGYFPIELGFPYIPGPEVSGEVPRLGSGVPVAAGLSEGDLVVINPAWGDGTCRQCHEGNDQLCTGSGGWIGFGPPGGYAEYVVAPSRHLIRIDPAMGLEPAYLAPLVDAALTPYRGMKKLRLGQPQRPHRGSRPGRPGPGQAHRHEDQAGRRQRPARRALGRRGGRPRGHRLRLTSGAAASSVPVRYRWERTQPREAVTCSVGAGVRVRRVVAAVSTASRAMAAAPMKAAEKPSASAGRFPSWPAPLAAATAVMAARPSAEPTW